VPEGINSTIKAINRCADGYRDEKYFSLRSSTPSPEFGGE
jgi:transposase